MAWHALSLLINQLQASTSAAMQMCVSVAEGPISFFSISQAMLALKHTTNTVN